MTTLTMNWHDITTIDGDLVACTRCGTAWDYPRPVGTWCPGHPLHDCYSDDGRGGHHFGVNGHCHGCGAVDRG